MKKRTCLKKKIMVSILSAAIVFSGMPVSGSEFTDSETEAFTEFPETEAEEFLSDDSREESALFSREEEIGEEGIRYIKGRPLTEEERAEQLLPMERLNPLGGVPEVDSDLNNARMYAMYPAEYDARDRGIVTIAKNQYPFGICWAFGMSSLLETSVLSQGKGNSDLSEEHLAYFFANRQNDPLGNTANDRNNHQGNYHEGGNDYLASVFLTTWSGMTTEMSVPLPTDANHVLDMSGPLPASKAYEASVYLKNASFSEYSVDRMKQLLMADDTVSFMYCMESQYYQPDTAAYSCPVKKGTNHVSVVVGWDDHYSKKNFAPDSGVTSDGAWIVKNSWGTGWGRDGYFYLSYEDKNISSLATAEAMTELRYPNNYFYDGSSGMSTVLLGPGQSVGNVFTASAGKGMQEILGEVNVITFSDNFDYSIQIYKDVQNADDPTSGTPVYEEPYRVSQPLAGVRTVEVPEVILSPKTKYSVVIRNQGVNTVKFCVEKDIDHGWVKCHADVQPGQGFWADSRGKWQDLYTSHATPRIKVHTRTAGKIPAPVLKASSKTYNQIELTWNSAAGADGYVIYRKEAGKNKKLVSVSALLKSYTDTSARLGVNYSYTIVPYVTVSGKQVAGEVSKAVSAASVLRTPVFRVRASADGYNQVTWKKVAGATSYRVYRRTPSGGWKLLASVKSPVLKYNDKKITALSSYIYTVKAYRYASGKTYAGKCAEGDVIKSAPALQKVSSVKAEQTGIRVRWSAQKKCDGYDVYRKKKGGSWSKIKVISAGSANSYLDKTAQKGVLYYYAVRAYVKEPYGNVYSRYTASSAAVKK